VARRALPSGPRTRDGLPPTKMFSMPYN
jgi:hypothetical protein